MPSIQLNDGTEITCENDQYIWDILKGFRDEKISLPPAATMVFTKLEKASLMIAQGLVSKYSLNSPEDKVIIARLSVELAEEVLKEANR